jgi:hypothetical protein
MPTDSLRPAAPACNLVLRGCLAWCASLALGVAFAAPPAATQDSTGSAGTVAKAKTKVKKHGAGKAAATAKPGPVADFGGTSASPDVVHVANWASYTHDAGRRSFIVIDKKEAQLYVFDPQGRLKGHTQVLVGKAIGDTAAPGVGNKPLSQLKESEKTTPAGRFLVGQGQNTHGDNILWIDYANAISMHRMHSVSAAERRAERMATPDPGDNRISNGCVNVPHAFYDQVLRPTVLKQGAIVYVLPETRTPQQLFGSFDVPPGKQSTTVAKAGPAAGKTAARS